jgi:hypothetical protein
MTRPPEYLCTLAYFGVGRPGSLWKAKSPSITAQHANNLLGSIPSVVDESVALLKRYKVFPSGSSVLGSHLQWLSLTSCS